MNSAIASAANAASARSLPVLPMSEMPLPNSSPIGPKRLNRLLAAIVVAGHALLFAFLPTGVISPASGSPPAVVMASWLDTPATSAGEEAVKPLPPRPQPRPQTTQQPTPQKPAQPTPRTPPTPAADKPSTLLTSTAAPTPSATSAVSTSSYNSPTAAATPVADGAAGSPQPTASAAAAAGGDAGPAGRISPPRFDADYLKNPAPAYPRSSRERGEAGLVVLRVLVSRDGLPLEIDLQRSSGFERLDEAALAAVRHWQFQPARQGGEAIAARVLVPISFNLRS